MTRGAVLFVADDFGLTTATSRTIVELCERGPVTAVSVLANAPATASTLPWLVGSTAIGVHLCLVGEDPPVCPPREIPTLVDRGGRFAASWRRLLPRLAAGRVDPDDVRRELRAQIGLVADAGATIEHLNSHQHLHLWPMIREATVELATEHGVGYVRTPRSNRSGPRAAAMGRLADQLSASLAAAGITTSDRFAGLDEAGAWTAPALAASLEGAGPGLLEVNVHPGAASDHERARYRWGYRWSTEAEALTSPTFAAALEASGRPLASFPLGT